MSEVARSIPSPAIADLGAGRLLLRQIAGLVAYTVRESVHRWTLIAYLLAISFFLLLLATAVNLDIVEGTLASARLFGQDLRIGDMDIRVEDAVRFVQIGIVYILYALGVVLALFLTSNYVPSLAREGWVDLLIAQPIGRSTLLLGRALGSITVVSIGIAYLIGGSWIVLRLKTGFGDVGFLVAGGVILFTYVVSYSATVLAGIVTRSAPVSGMVGFMVWIAGHVMYAFHSLPEWRVALRAGWPRQVATAISESLYWALPKNQGLSQLAVAAARGETLSWDPILYSLPFAAACAAAACWWFARRDY